jgi:deoxyadenosine/deoxycytidine kinase
VALYITLCGNIGVGKTTLAGIMAERWRWQLFQESVGDHPYLADYYADRTRWALASQLVFLERTFRQQLTITRGEVNSVQERSAAENYMVFARTLFEEAILSPREFGTLSDLYYLLEDAVRPANLLVYLRASEDTLLDRIALRGRSYESGGVDRDYLAALNRSYDRFYREYQIGPKLEINMNDFDIALRPSDAAEVLRQIAGATGYDPELVLF